MFRDKKSDQLSLVLSDFWEQLFPKVQDTDAIPKITQRIESWVGQQPRMTEVLCNYVLKYASQINETDAGGIVDRIVQRDILGDWENSDASVHLNKIAAAITAYEQKDILLLLYMQILQRGSVVARKSPEQEALLSSGLVIEKDRKLRVANRLYAKIFDTAWIEQQLPGITRPVAIIENAAERNKRPSLTAGLYSKLAVSVCCLAVLGASVSAYLKEASSQSALATQDSTEVVEPTSVSGAAADTSTETAASTVPDAAPNAATEETVEVSDKALYDKGIEHATNGRWLPMTREFCALSESSTYFWTAEKQLEQWLELYPEDIEIAKSTFEKETGATCPILTKAIENVSGAG